jgi:hypothetical protein
MVVMQNMITPISTWIFKTFFSETWKKLAGAKGFLRPTAQEELMLRFRVWFHHEYSGFLVLVGYLTNNPLLTRHGILFETGYDLLDIYLIIFRKGIYGGPSPPRESFVRATLAHHIPSVLCNPFLILFNVHDNDHFEQMWIALLLIGGISLGINAVSDVLGVCLDVGSVGDIAMRLLLVFETFG